MAWWIGDRDEQGRYAVTSVRIDGTYTIGHISQRKMWETTKGAQRALDRIAALTPSGARALTLIFGVSSDHTSTREIQEAIRKGHNV